MPGTPDRRRPKAAAAADGDGAAGLPGPRPGTDPAIGCYEALRAIALAADRAGFQHLVAEVSLGRAGIVLGLECSRLARDSADWQQLVKICAHTDTLILDEDGLYDPAILNDRVLLGMKGQIPEFELHFLRARIRGAIRAQTRRRDPAPP